MGRNSRLLLRCVSLGLFLSFDERMSTLYQVQMPIKAEALHLTITVIQLHLKDLFEANPEITQMKNKRSKDLGL